MSAKEEAELVPSQICVSANGTEIVGHYGVLARIVDKGSGKCIEFPEGIPSVPSHGYLAMEWILFFISQHRLPKKEVKPIKVEPVMIPVMPMFDEDGNPTCVDCVFRARNYGCVEDWGDHDSNMNPIPGQDCPIHNQKAHEGMEPV